MGGCEMISEATELIVKKKRRSIPGENSEH